MIIIMNETNNTNEPNGEDAHKHEERTVVCLPCGARGFFRVILVLTHFFFFGLSSSSFWLLFSLHLQTATTKTRRPNELHMRLVGGFDYLSNIRGPRPRMLWSFGGFDHRWNLSFWTFVPKVHSFAFCHTSCCCSRIKHNGRHANWSWAIRGGQSAWVCQQTMSLWRSSAPFVDSRPKNREIVDNE